VDCYAPADGTMAAASPNDISSIVTRFDNTYTGLTADAGTADDTYFNGTSAACPVACGFLATVLQHNRAWDWSNIKDYIKNTIEEQTSATMFIGDDYADPYDEGWLETRSLAGSDPIVLYEGPYTISTPYPGPVRATKGALQFRNGINLRFKK